MRIERRSFPRGLLFVAVWLLWVAPPAPADDGRPAGNDDLDELEKLNDDLWGFPEEGAAEDEDFENLEDANKALRGESEEQLGEKDPIKILGTAREKMRDAQEILGRASRWGEAGQRQQEAQEEIEKLLREAMQGQSSSSQSASDAEKAMEEAASMLEKMFRGAENSQQGALEGIEELIRLAREHSGGQPSQPQPQKPNQRRPRNPDMQQKPQGPADKPYEVPPHEPPINRAGQDPDASKRWGDLQDLLRDELFQMRGEDLIPEYRARLEEYFKRLAGEE